MSQWISVKEKLPELQKQVLIAGEWGGVGMMLIAWRDEAIFGTWLDSHGPIRTAAITHWQPLPDPPEAGNP